MNQLARPSGGSPWINVPEDDVIVRCLVRANIALMHPSDGSKIRLVEFHKEVEGTEMEED
jgi:Centromere-associated protein K